MIDRVRQRVEEFLFLPESDRWLGFFRMSVALQVMFYCFSLRKDWVDLFAIGQAGVIKRDLAEAILSAESHYIPRFGWVVDWLSGLGCSEQTALAIGWWSLLGAGFFLFIGLFSREAAIIALFLHLCAVKSSSGLTYGVDNFTSIGLFYLAISPLPDQWAADRWFRRLPGKQSQWLGFSRRVLQLHLCLIYFFSGITKCAGGGWWDGTSIWYALVRPPFNLLPAERLVALQSFFPILGISVCLLETGYPLFMWLRRTRAFWLVAVIAMHLAIGLAMGLYLFAFVMITLNLAAFGWQLRWDTIGRSSTPEVAVSTAAAR
jgi:Vitamin K-dependent gamma-carboxylase